MTASAPRLLCDEMLHRLGRWLRAAGYDTAIAGGGLADREVLALAAAEARVLVTRDQALAARARVSVVGLGSDDLDACAGELRTRLGIDWLRAPFSRCLVDNTPLVPATAADRERLPAGVWAPDQGVTACPSCGRLYWPGGHERRMRARLAGWKAG